MGWSWRVVAVLCFSLFGVPALAQPAAVAEARVIVKYRSASSAAGMPGASKASAPAAMSKRLQSLGMRRGVSLKAHRGLSDTMQVVTAQGLTSADLVRRLNSDADVEFAVPDRRMKRAALPNDSLFEAGGVEGPAAGQWYLKAPTGEVRSSIDAVSAWDLTTGSANIVIAVLDTGVRFDHPDLLAASAGGKLLPGYDFVRTSIANDGDGLDADASDPGDWVTQADIDNGVVRTDCTVEDSSWHGTQVTGIAAALSHNASGMAGASWGARVLPLRVLGKCGGFQSEIIAAMRWAVGLPVPNAPQNTTPARVLNLSLGGPGACDAAYQGAIDEVIAAGAVIVASAGNSAGHTVGSPANCSGVISVGGLRHAGTKVGFSDLGAGVAISAPGGNCVTVPGPCVYPILTTTDSGRQGPSGPAYTNSRDASVGTSFSAPLVSGTVALMLSVHPRATPAQVTALLQGSAAPFPSTGAASSVVACTAPQFDAQGAPIDQLECYCSTTTCGAGMLDARAAVQAARAQAVGTTGLQALITVAPATPVAGEAFVLDASSTLLAPGVTLSGTTWSLLDGGGIVASLDAVTPQVPLTASGAGTVRVQLEVLDSLGNRSIESLAIRVLPGAVTAAAANTPVAAPEASGGGGAIGVGYLAALLAAVLAAWRARRPSRRR